MKDLKKELFNFKKKLTFEQDDICKIAEAHYDACDNMSEKAVINSLNSRLNDYSYDSDVKSLMEELSMDMMSNELLYNLKDLYKMVEKRNLGGTIYRQPLNVLLEIINMNSDDDRMGKILNELSIYEWVPEIKTFVYNLTQNPEQKANLLNGGNAETVFSLVESVEDGHLAFINDAWFLLKEDSIEKTLFENHVKDEDKVRSIRTLESALQHTEIFEDRINFKVSESLIIGISTKDKGTTFINEEKASKETTLENLFQSPIIPIVNKNFYPLIMEVSNNIDKFVELDVVKRVTNIENPFIDIYAINYKDNIYAYRCDSRNGNSFFKYESATEIINDVLNELKYDLTYFYEDKLSEEVNSMRRLEDKEREIQVDLEDIDTNIDKVEANIKLLGESEQLTTALNLLTEAKKDRKLELDAIKELKHKEVTKA